MGRFRTGFALVAVLFLGLALGGRTYALMQEDSQDGLLKAADEITQQVGVLKIRGGRRFSRRGRRDGHFV